MFRNSVLEMMVVWSTAEGEYKDIVHWKKEKKQKEKMTVPIGFKKIEGE